MHIEKNVCDSIIGILLNILDKTKDIVKSKLDLVEMHICDQLAPEKRGQNTYLPPACYTLSKKYKIKLYQCLVAIKVPRGYLSNI